eukprot:3525556-Pyramimonas_sp.AAC.1
MCNRVGRASAAAAGLAAREAGGKHVTDLRQPFTLALVDLAAEAVAELRIRQAGLREDELHASRDHE